MVFSLGNNLLFWFQDGEMFHKYPSCDFSVPIQISPWTHGPCSFSPTPSSCSPQAQGPGPGRATSHSEEIFNVLNIVLPCLNSTLVCPSCHHAFDMNSSKSFGPSLQSWFQSIPAGRGMSSPVCFGRAAQRLQGGDRMVTCLD